jgi:hypothetical protein
MDRVVHAPYVFTASGKQWARSPNCPPVGEGEQIIVRRGNRVTPRDRQGKGRSRSGRAEVVGCRLLDRAAEHPVPERVFGLQLDRVRGRTALRALGGICGRHATEGRRDDAVRITALLFDGLRYGAEAAA